MFGPDICGYATKKIHVILSHPDAKDGKTIKNHLIKKDLRAEDDQLSHVYTLRLMPNNTYAVYVDKKEVAQGKLEEDWDMLPPAKIKVRGEHLPEDELRFCARAPWARRAATCPALLSRSLSPPHPQPKTNQPTTKTNQTNPTGPQGQEARGLGRARRDRRPRGQEA